jgi:hypothetical protein
LLITENRDCEVKMLFIRLDVRYVIRFTSVRPVGELMIDWENIWGMPSTHWHHRMLTTNQSLALHNNSLHNGLEPNLEFDILRIESDTVRRKITEAMLFIKLKPSINKREELDTIKRFLISNSWFGLKFDVLYLYISLDRAWHSVRDQYLYIQLLFIRPYLFFLIRQLRQSLLDDVGDCGLLIIGYTSTIPFNILKTQ